jgi:membrane peptidoglycan carboxypeptidase
LAKLKGSQQDCEGHNAALEQHWTKDQILEEYLNRLDYGDLQIRLASASVDYFEKPPSDLSAAEAAFLAAIPQAPSLLLNLSPMFVL